MLTVRRAPRTRVAVPATLGALEASAAFAFAHVVAGGAVPGPLWLAAFGALVYAGSHVVLRRRAPIRVVLPALVAAQVLGHAWLAALGPAGAAAHHPVHPGHGADDAALLGLSPSMVLAHAAAAVLTGVMWSLRRRAVDVLLHWAEPVRPVTLHRARVLVGGHRPAAAIRWILAAAPHRGPPVVGPTRATAPA